MAGGTGGDRSAPGTARGVSDKKPLASENVTELLGPNLKYGTRSELRKACSRFLRFSYLLDFVTMEALSNIYINSVVDLVGKLEHLNNVPVNLEFMPRKSSRI